MKRFKPYQLLISVYLLFGVNPFASALESLNVYKGLDYPGLMPNVCDVSDLKLLCTHDFKAFRHFEGPKLGFLTLDDSYKKVYSERVSSQAHIESKRKYAVEFLDKFKSNDRALNLCCGGNLNCRNKLKETVIDFDFSQRTRFDAQNNVIRYNKEDVIKANFVEEIEATLIHEMGHACDLAFVFGKTGKVITTYTTPETIEKVLGNDFLACLRDEDYEVQDGTGLRLNGYHSETWGWPKIYTEAFAEAVFFEFRKTPWHWLEYSCGRPWAGYKMGSKCGLKLRSGCSEQK